MDPIADLLSSIKNGYLAKKKEISQPSSKMKENLARILVEEGYLEKLETGKNLILTLKYEGKKPALDDLKRVSKPGLRVYSGKMSIERVLGGLGIAIVSTSQGLMTDKKAREKGLGGEIICQVW